MIPLSLNTRRIESSHSERVSWRVIMTCVYYLQCNKRLFLENICNSYKGDPNFCMMPLVERHVNRSGQPKN